MKFDYRWALILAFVVIVNCGGEAAYEEPAAAAEEAEAMDEAPAEPTVAQMQADCATAAEAIAARQAESSLYDRLGGRDAIFTVVTDIVARHRVNPAIMHLMEGVDDAHLIEQVTNFLSQAAGGDVAYEGKDMMTAHMEMGLTDEFFLAAGGDVQAGMAAAGVGENEIQEMLCLFASLHDQVVHS